MGKKSSPLRVDSLRKELVHKNASVLNRLAVLLTVMIGWLLIWALVFKLGSEKLLVGNYNNLKDMNLEERIMWDLIPFNYRGTPEMKLSQFMDTVLNCFVFSPIGVLFCYLFEKKSVIRDVSICLAFSIFIETLQLATMLGNPAPEDLMTNVVGYFIGILIYHLLLKRISVSLSVKLMRVCVVICSVAVIFSLVTTIKAAPVIFKIITRTL